MPLSDNGANHQGAGFQRELHFRTLGDSRFGGIGSRNAQGEAVTPALDGGFHGSTSYLHQRTCQPGLRPNVERILGDYGWRVQRGRSLGVTYEVAACGFGSTSFLERYSV
jgi:hypothetical protein